MHSCDVVHPPLHLNTHILATPLSLSLSLRYAVYVLQQSNGIFGPSSFLHDPPPPSLSSILILPLPLPLMATIATRALNPNPNSNPDPKPMRACCFSFAAYAKTLIGHLRSCGVPVAHGLSDDEFSAIESSLNFTFPPDLRSILREGLPLSPGFPNWRAASPHHLRLLTALPVFGLSQEISRADFWINSWGDRPDNAEKALLLANPFLSKAPILVPIYRRFYIPSTPIAAGNPVFFVHGGDVRLSSFDLAGFFQNNDFRLPNSLPVTKTETPAPAWAAKAPRTIDFWTEVAERGKGVARGFTYGGWWSGNLGGCLEEVFWRLRDGGWKEEEVREMMMMDGADEEAEKPREEATGYRERVGVWCHVQRMSFKLLSAGWSAEDVGYSLGFEDGSFVTAQGEPWAAFQRPDSCSQEMY
ncbi:uncharacterized protein LOC131158466 [Malania oleifera]|uniref:uncharacterized protein LOC131158466 n=1 Tax=Malania oleifera TaxID=397392 RepID=UPI0025AE13E6|nr:uncharacterized protein LOC131158466 [Malania oleifera]